jgi:hypothetical protein
MRCLLISLGLLIAAIGLHWPWLSKLPFARLFVDLVIDRSDFNVFAPFTAMIVLSLVPSLISGCSAARAALGAHLKRTPAAGVNLGLTRGADSSNRFATVPMSTVSHTPRQR